MDPQVRWLKRFLLGRAATRAALEAVLVGGGVIAACWLVAVEPAVTAALAVVCAQLYLMIRLVAAVLFNPVNHRYLMGWEDEADRLRPSDRHERDRSPLDVELDRIALHHLVRLGMPDPEGDPRVGDPAREPNGGGFDVYVSRSRLVVVAVDADRRLSVLSKLTDGRLLVTTTETVPPHQDVILNPIGETSSPRILLRHVERLDSLRPDGIQAMPAGYEVVVDQLRLEWSSWNQLGPFVGPFLAVDPRPQPHLLQFRPSAELLRRLSSSARPERLTLHRFRTPPIGRGRPPGGALITVEVPCPAPDRITAGQPA